MHKRFYGLWNNGIKFNFVGKYWRAVSGKIKIVRERPIASNSVANPTVVTTPSPHFLRTGESVEFIENNGSTPSLVGTHVVTRISPTTFSITVNVTAGGSAGAFEYEAQDFIVESLVGAILEDAQIAPDGSPSYPSAQTVSGIG